MTPARIFFAIVPALFFAAVFEVWAAPQCLYLDEAGRTKAARSLFDVPVASRKNAKCFTADAQNTYLASPEEMKLKGAQVDNVLSTPLGRIHVRGIRSMESVFGRTPDRAVIEASQTVSRVLHQPGWPSHVSSFAPDWKIVFLDEKLPETQIPMYLISTCHPGWMTPPTNIYIVAQRVASGCGQGTSFLKSDEADARMMNVLLHEMGHVVEYALLDQRQSSQRMLAEGFATWFEYYAADFSPITRAAKDRDLLRRSIEAAARSYDGSAAFGPSAADYANAAAPFLAIAKRRGVRGIVELYNVLKAGNIDLPGAARKMFGWSNERFLQEVRSVGG